MAKPADIVSMTKRTRKKPGKKPTELTGQPQVMTRLAPDIHDKLIKDAEDSMRSLSSQVSWIVSQYYRNRK